jgi:hypothetical protein
LIVVYLGNRVVESKTVSLLSSLTYDTIPLFIPITPPIHSVKFDSLATGCSGLISPLSLNKSLKDDLD